MSASDTSDISVNKTDISGQLAASQNVLNDDKYWWNTQSSSDESDNSIEEGLKDGLTWLKADTKLAIVQSSDGHPLVSAQDSTSKQPLVLPTAAASASQSSSGGGGGGEDFTHDSLGWLMTCL